MFVNRGGSSYREVIIPGVTWEVGARCASATDIDDDGYDDLLVCGNEGLRIYRNTGDGRFENMAPALELANRHAHAIAIDLDGDDDRDLVLTTGGKTRVRLQTGVWEFGPARIVATGEARTVATPDIDDDGDIDLYVVRDGAGPNLPDVLLVNRGQGTFDASVVAVPRRRATARWGRPSITTVTAGTPSSSSTRTTPALCPGRWS